MISLISPEGLVPRSAAAPVAFLVRLPARLHMRAKDAAWRRRVSLNKLITDALAAYLRPGARTKKGGRA